MKSLLALYRWVQCQLLLFSYSILHEQSSVGVVNNENVLVLMSGMQRDVEEEENGDTDGILFYSFSLSPQKSFH